jgi:hypothetical protein
MKPESNVSMLLLERFQGMSRASEELLSTSFACNKVRLGGAAMTSSDSERSAQDEWGGDDGWVMGRIRVFLEP